VYNISGGTLTTGTNFQVGAYGIGTLNISGTGNVTLTGGYTDSGRFAGSVGNINVTGGSLNQNTNNKMIVGEAGTGTMSVGSGAANSGAVNLQGGLVMGLDAGSKGTFNLNTGGTLTTPSISGTNNAVGTAAGAPTGASTFNFNGGTLTVTANNGAGANGAFMVVTTANVQSGGAVFNTNGNTVTVSQALVHDTTAGAPALDGGLTKNGAGTLVLSGADTYTGPTTVNAGMLSASALNSLGAGSLLLSSSTTPWVNLLFSGTETISGLSFDMGSTFVTPGTYGASGSGATNQLAAFTGGGILSVAAAPEPSQFAALGLGLLGLGGLLLKARRRKALDA
jgi:autotransporter-associated beta strand protein/T5SS/PEP-CTERM-associated repeat protein